MADQVTAPWHILPSELLPEILSWLPVKSLCRFRCVSKSWLSLISHPNFVKMHFNKAIEYEHMFYQRRRLIFTDAKRDSFYHFDLDEYLNLYNQNPFLSCIIGKDCDRDLVVTRLLLPPPSWYRSYISYPKDRWTLVSFCCGLVLFELSLGFFVANPATNKYKILPHCPYLIGTRPFMPFYGFGYDNSTDDFKVILSKHSKVGIEFMVYSLKTGSWRQIQSPFPYKSDPQRRKSGHTGPSSGPPLSYDTNRPCTGILLNGRLHWFMWRLEDDTRVIVSLCLAEEKVREIPLPFDVDLGTLQLGLFSNDSLCIGYAFYTGMTLDFSSEITFNKEFWVMKEYEVAESWTKRELCSGSEGSLLPSRYRKENHALFWCTESEPGWRMNSVKALCYQSLSIPGYPTVTGAGFYVESLVSLDTGRGTLCSFGC